ncbi:conjugal transfer protein [Priestia megaterium]|uniref:conjugal transfer protein n=1 Tax=Priestia megaterium TaxID=1404 RepID=UPI00366A7306
MIKNENKVKRSKNEKRTLPQAKQVGRFARFIVWAVIVIICLTGTLGLLRAQNALNKSKQALAAVEDKHNNNYIDRSVYSSPKLTIFGEDVVKAYVPISANADDREKQATELAKYYANGVSTPLVGDFKGRRDLNDYELFNVVQEQNRALMQYKISYTNVVNEEKEREVEKQKGDKKEKVKEKYNEDKATDKQALLNIPVKAVGNSFVVVESPYFSAVPSLKGQKAKAISNPYNDDQLVKTDRSDSVQKWLTDEFFPKYASETKADMSYMMEKPETLNGLQEFEGIDSVKVYPGKKKNEYTAKVIATFSEKEIDVKQDIGFTMTLRESDDKYFLETMKHTLGGK